jgi:hypothetical protein
MMGDELDEREVSIEREFGCHGSLSRALGAVDEDGFDVEVALLDGAGGHGDFGEDAAHGLGIEEEAAREGLVELFFCDAEKGDDFFVVEGTGEILL